ncbi:hypothetical protein B0H19DRAFT_1061793 [Mycena capillaripes]|nr:hypothetical protein B0H19DRAFT_1061793 [Mycena capillaripes]
MHANRKDETQLPNRVAMQRLLPLSVVRWNTSYKGAVQEYHCIQGAPRLRPTQTYTQFAKDCVGPGKDVHNPWQTESRSPFNAVYMDNITGNVSVNTRKADLLG